MNRTRPILPVALVPDGRRRFQFRLDGESGSPPIARLLIRVTAAIARGAVLAGDQLPTVRQLAVDLSRNPNTVIRAYRELEIRGVLETRNRYLIGQVKPEGRQGERERRLGQLVSDFL